MEAVKDFESAGERDQGAIARVSLPFVWAWATHFDFTRHILRMLCGYSEHQRRVQVEGCVAEPLHDSIGVEWSCSLLRIALQDASREVTQVYPP